MNSNAKQGNSAARRLALKGLACTGLGASNALAAGMTWATSQAQNSVDAAPLAGKPRAEGKPAGTLFGSAVKTGPLSDSPWYRALLTEWCDVIVAEGGMKWDALRPDATRFDFTQTEVVLDFATRNALQARGHTLVWHQALPAWVRALNSPEQARLALCGHIEKVVQQASKRVQSWDVVNEVLPDKTTAIGQRRASVWQHLLGDDYIAMAFRTAALHAPHAELVVNEYDLEFRGAHSDHKRNAMLALLGELRQQDVPVHALGLEGHLRSDRELDRRALGRFLKEVQQLGLNTLITEMDVMDHALSADVVTRDREAASRVDELLDTVFSVQPPTQVLTWGLADRLAWIPDHFKRKDGLGNRPLPLDEAGRPKEMMRVIERYRHRHS